MNVLEKILEELEERGNIQFSSYTKPLIAVEDVLEIIRSHMDDAKDTDVHTNDDWIPVEERLPEAEGKPFYDMQLVTIEDGEVCLGVYRNEEKEWWTRRNEGEKQYTNKHDVVAWQPLPKSYKPKKDISAAGTEHVMSRFMKVEVSNSGA